MSELFRHMMIHGIYLEFDHEEMKKIQRSVANIANNVNQIAFRVNSTSHIYKQELFEIQESVAKLWEELHFVQKN